MDKPQTIRRRLERAVAYFHRQEALVLTTFNLSASFLYEQALPILLGVDANTSAAKEAEVHQRLGAVPCTLFYDPSASPDLPGKYRITARHVPLQGRLFHPKMVIIAGHDRDNRTWVYLAVSSANLTLSGWGRNAECFGETWIQAKNQQTWTALDGFLTWLQDHAPLGERAGQGDAVARVRAALARMPSRRQFPHDKDAPWSGTLSAQLYTSVTHPQGLADFMQMGRARRPRALHIFSPYWSDVAAQITTFNARKTTLIPARQADGSSLSLASDQAQNLPKTVEICRNTQDIGDRFWHMKLYRVVHGKKAYTAVGSCNFTQAGLVGGHGNVEAALVYERDAHQLPLLEPAHESDLASKPLPEEGAPRPCPIMILVAYDWRARSWRWWLKASLDQRNFKLHLPNTSPFKTRPGTTELSGDPPPAGATFKITYESSDGEESWEAHIIELNLDFSARTYGRPLSVDEILESWRGRAPTWDLGSIESNEGRDEEEGHAHIDHDTSTALNALNLYDFYRSTSSLRRKLRQLKGHPQAQRAHLVGRSDSLMTLANMAHEASAPPAIRYLLLHELYGVTSDWRALIDEDLLDHLAQMTLEARAQLEGELASEKLPAQALLDWFEVRLNEDEEKSYEAL